MAHKTTIIALAGKGGVGKTSLSAAIVRALSEQMPDKKLLAIDADPAVGLSVALGVEVRETLDEIRLRVAKEVTEGLGAAQDILAEAKFRIIDALAEEHGFAFLAIGRPEAAGCYCAVNTYLRQVIGMLADDFDYVVIDGEAGIEQINRRVMDRVTHLLLISDQSRKGIDIIRTIHTVAKDMVMADRTAAVLNRVPYPDKLGALDLGDLELACVIGPDELLMENDVEGKSVFELPADAAILKGAKEALQKLEILK